MSDSNHAMPVDSTKTLDDLCGEGLFSVGGVKNPRFLFPTQKTVDACREVVGIKEVRRNFFVNRYPTHT